ncbi:hypothetical protein EXIGLDRAFT_759256 [Exidia glandulosa HHB12029]|uniref:F-box domain-containing protein n=1 Tax=Exidia glandulosa HHB12029 TaxID=1314781 RepID=A0A165QC47_EXIGL|nr:hypothetical protein EXIGLDRAFT_759256 [Exidia glandulosa HHB12029]
MSTRAAAELKLPIELILLAIEHAALDDLDAKMQISEKAIRRWRHWVAGLCIVCRALEPAMARILYTLVHVHPGNVDAVVRAAEMDTRPFRRARAVYFDMEHTDTSALCASFQHVHACTGELHYLRPLLNKRVNSHDLRPLSVHLTLANDIFELSTVVVTAERLHLAYVAPRLTSYDDLSRFRTRFLILDIHPATSDDAIEKLSQLLRIQTLERILVRPSVPWNVSGAQPLRDRIRSFAETARSAIIWFDDSFPTYTVGELIRHRHLFDAMRGDDLWLGGCQLYVPGTDA